MNMDINTIFQSKAFKGLLIGIGIFILILTTLKIGIVVGLNKANFARGWSENYHRNFGGPRGGFFQPFDDRELIDGHGVFGKIIKIDGSALIIKGKDNVEKVVVTDDGTSINRLRESIKVSDLKVDDYIVVIGEPDSSGQINAKLIRFMPAPPPGETSFMPPNPPYRNQ